MVRLEVVGVTTEVARRTACIGEVNSVVVFILFNSFFFQFSPHESESEWKCRERRGGLGVAYWQQLMRGEHDKEQKGACPPRDGRPTVRYSVPRPWSALRLYKINSSYNM